MSKQNLKNILSVSARILLAFMFVFGQTAWAGQNQDPKGKPSGNSSAKTQQQSQANASRLPAAKPQPMEKENAAEQGVVAQEKYSGSGGHEGIKVHGHWTIEVRNPDGSLVTHREFENSLQSAGASALAAILGASQTVGFWQVELTGAPQPCFETLASIGGPRPVVCAIVPSFFNPFPGSTGYFQTLVTTSSAGQLTLSGTAIAGESGNIQTVITHIYLCAATTAPSSCQPPLSSSSGVFTQAQLQTPVAVTTGQTIAVTVVISFS